MGLSDRAVIGLAWCGTHGSRVSGYLCVILMMDLERRAGILGRMPEVSRFFGIVIHMYFGEHGVPHFHAIHGEHEISVPCNQD